MMVELQQAWEAGKPAWVVVANHPLAAEHRIGMRRAKVALLLDRPNKEIAEQLGVSVQTIQDDRKAITGGRKHQVHTVSFRNAVLAKCQTKSTREVAAELGVGVGVVAGIVHRSRRNGRATHG